MAVSVASEAVQESLSQLEEGDPHRANQETRGSQIHGATRYLPFLILFIFMTLYLML